MGGPQSAPPAAGNRRAGGEALVLLAGPASAAERVLVSRWLRDGHLRPSAVLPLDGPGLARSLDRAVPETVVTAVRVAWLPRERGGERRVGWSDVLSQVNPRRPPAFWQGRIMRREPDRARMVVAEPATVAALRGRWGGTGSFDQFVSRQARLALDRSERALLGERYKVPKEVTEAIEDGPHFRAEVARLASQLGLTEQEAMGRAEADLDSLVASIRRSFGDDEIYKLALREYLGFLLAKRFNLEWYMEGGRSRTGKLRPPRYGLLAYVAEAVARGRAEDAWLVPVAITYDQLREVSAMAAEQAGAAKKAEGLGWLAGYARGQLVRVGAVRVRFAEPISLRAAVPPGGPDGDKDAWRLALQKVAFEVAVRINRVTPVTATALVTLALLGVRDRALTLGQVRAVMEPLRGYLTERELPHSREILESDAGVRRVLGTLSQQNVVTVYAGGEEPVYAIDRGQHLVAAFYRNSAIHHFLDRAVAEMVLLSHPADRWDEAMRLRDQLKFEFFFPDKTAYRAVLQAELDRLDPGWETVADGRAVLERSDLLVANRVLRSFVDAQLVVAERLTARPPGQPVAEKQFLDECRGVGQQMLLQGRLHGPESLSRELFASALQLAANLDLLGPGGDDLEQRRRAFAGRLHEDVARLILIDEIDAAGRREAIGVEP